MSLLISVTVARAGFFERKNEQFDAPSSPISLLISGLYVRVNLSSRFSELAVFDARLYIRVRRINKPA